jgi:hypothetical protein
MNKMTVKPLYIILIFFSVVAYSLYLVGCQKYYWDYDCNWVSEEPSIELYKGCGNGQMTINDVKYEFYTAQSNNATHIDFYEKETNSNNNFEKLLWQADTKMKDGKLYLTITLDNISNLEGKTIILSQKDCN